jgi:hypothetical protein
MTSTTSEREDLDRALFGTSVTQGDGLFAGGEGEPTISGVLAFPEVGFLRCDDPILWLHPRFQGEFPQALYDLEIRNAPGVKPEMNVQQAKQTKLLRNLRFVENKR